MLYKTKLLEEFYEDTKTYREKWIVEFRNLALERLEEVIREKDYLHLINECIDVHHRYSSEGDAFLALDQDAAQAKSCYYLAARAGALCYDLRRAGFPYYRGKWIDHNDFKKMNINFSKDGILAEDRALTLSMTGEDTIEGLLVLGRYEEAQRALPPDPEDQRLTDEIDQCTWAVAYGNQKAFDKYLQRRIGVLRRQGRHNPCILDGWGLALVRLARQRGMTCKVKVIELPWELLEDTPVETAGLALPFEETVREIIRQKEKGEIAL